MIEVVGICRLPCGYTTTPFISFGIGSRTRVEKDTLSKMEPANLHDVAAASEPNKYPAEPAHNEPLESQEGDNSEPSTESKAPPCAPSRDSPNLSKEEGEEMFRTLRSIFEPAEQQQQTGELEDLIISLELADKATRDGRPNIQALDGVTFKIDQLWRSRSEYMVQTVEVLANASRDRKFS